jgi:HAD superfamily hydrolase (TIGR01509 family)
LCLSRPFAAPTGTVAEGAPGLRVAATPGEGQSRGRSRTGTRAGRGRSLAIEGGLAPQLPARAAMIRCAIFDIDGTLLDSVDLHAAAWAETFRAFGIAVDASAVRGQIGKGGDQLMPVFVPPERLERDGAAIERHRSELFKATYLPRVKPFPGVRALFAHLRGEGHTLALASSGKADEVRHYMEIADIADLVDVATNSDEADRSKPHPDIFEAALDKLGRPGRRDAIVIGDSPYDAEAAGKAGLAALGVLCGGFPEADLGAAGCRAVYRDPQDLLDGYDRSPLRLGLPD